MFAKLWPQIEALEIRSFMMTFMFLLLEPNKNKQYQNIRIPLQAMTGIAARKQKMIHI